MNPGIRSSKAMNAILCLFSFQSHTGCDIVGTHPVYKFNAFQSTHPMRDATGQRVRCGVILRDNFNPRIPCGMRRLSRKMMSTARLFQSTHPMRDATLTQKHGSTFTHHFNPRIPCGMRPALYKAINAIPVHISIHASHAGCDTSGSLWRWPSWRFQSTHPMRDATAHH